MEINPAQLNPIKPLRPNPASPEQQLGKAKEVQEKFREVMGELFFGQLMKAMRTSQGKPAYFHGGQAEELFQNQLDQVLAQEMTEASAAQIIDPMFAQKFPNEAELLKLEAKQQTASLDELQQLRRR